MKTLAAKILGVLTRLALMKHKPVVIGVTGSVGKTSTKDALAAVLGARYSVRASSGNFNNEFGLPLTVLGQNHPGSNTLAWLWTMLTSLLAIIGGKYPHVLILEMGSDRPGDIAYLLKLTGQLDYAVVTDIGVSHLMNYSSRDALAKEKLTLARGIKPNGMAVLNSDNDYTAGFLAGKSSLRVNTFGLDNPADVMGLEIKISHKDGQPGLNFKIKHAGNIVPALVPDALGRPNAYAALAAATVALGMGMNLVEISEGLGNYHPPAGRLRLMPGIKRTQVIDDTYNAAPSSTVMALDVLTEVAGGRKIAALGGMAELGAQNDAGHREVAIKVQECGVGLVFLVGGDAKIIQDELRKRQFKGIVHWYPDSDSARMPVQNELREGDTILVKGSQSARMEKVVKEIMADPMQAEKLLVRQSEYWLAN